MLVCNNIMLERFLICQYVLLVHIKKRKKKNGPDMKSKWSTRVYRKQSVSEWGIVV